MNKLFWMLAEETTEAGDVAGGLTDKVTNLWADVIQPIFETVLWVLVAALAMFLVIKAVMTAMAVMKAADEPQVRQEKIQGFKYLAIALVIAILVLSFANVITGMLTDAAGSAGEGSSFLF